LTAAWLIAAALLAAATAPAPSPAPSPTPCAHLPAGGALDFWIGDWDVFAGGRKAGENRIRKIVGGCAVTEESTDASGGRGFSLFYSDGNGTWKQVWVTENPLAPGGLKEKTLLSADGGVRFQGEPRLPGGRTYLDRTTLTPLPGGEVRQLIEISTDGGKTWKATFDGRYVRR
jgi:hypothetical protein